MKIPVAVGRPRVVSLLDFLFGRLVGVMEALL